MTKSSEGDDVARGLVPAREEMAERSLDSYTAFSVTAYGSPVDGQRELQFRAVTLDGATRRTVAHDLGSQPFGCDHELCAAIDAAERFVEWVADRTSPVDRAPVTATVALHWHTVE